MTRPYKLRTSQPITPSHPLHWTRFWPDKQRLHRASAEARQDLVIWLAHLHSVAIKRAVGHSYAFCEQQIRLTDLRELVRDFQPALDYFFEVKQRGFSLEDSFELTTIVPKHVSQEIAEYVGSRISYVVPERPENAVISKVYLRDVNFTELHARVVEAGRGDLSPALRWLESGLPELNFHFVPAGKLQQRDTSVWPIVGIETWPSWLREELFGGCIDLDSAYVQFLLTILEKARDRRELMELRYPDLIRLLHDKEAVRREICEVVFGCPLEEKLAETKQLIMSLANGSKCSAAMLRGGSSFSNAVGLVLENRLGMTEAELHAAGERLARIARQFASARQVVCQFKLGRKPSRSDLKGVFGDYFAWEREARYAIWHEIDQHGIMLHDGIDGVPDKYLDRLDDIMQKLNLRLTA